MNEIEILRMCLPVGFLILGVVFLWGLAIVDILTRKPTEDIGTKHTVNRIYSRYGWLIEKTTFWCYFVLAGGLSALNEWIGASFALLMILFHKKITKIMIYGGAKLAIFLRTMVGVLVIIGLSIALIVQNCSERFLHRFAWYRERHAEM